MSRPDSKNGRWDGRVTWPGMRTERLANLASQSVASPARSDWRDKSVRSYLTAGIDLVMNEPTLEIYADTLDEMKPHNKQIKTIGRTALSF